MNKTQKSLNGSTQVPALREQDAVAIVFFDGVCGFCNHTVNFLMKRDPNHTLRFAPLQGETAEAMLRAELRNRLDTIVFLKGERTYIRSAAVVRILSTIGGVWFVAAGLLWMIPLPLRDVGYRLMSSIRYRLFGKRDACRLPLPEERGLILQ